MKKSLVFAVMMAIATTCAASEVNECVNENIAEPVENVVDEVLNAIEGYIVSTTFYADKDNLYLVEYGTRFIRVRDFRTRELVYTLSIYLCKENGSWVNGANSVMRDASGTFVPAKAIRTKKGMEYPAAFCTQMIPVNRVKQLEKMAEIKI